MRHRYNDNWHVKAQVDSHTLVRLNGKGVFLSLGPISIYNLVGVWGAGDDL